MVKRIKSKLRTEDIIEKLRHPERYNKAAKSATQPENQPAQTPVVEEETVWGGRLKKKDLPTVLVAAGCAVLVMLTLFFFLLAKNRAEDLVAALDPDQVKGLMSEQNDFNPNADVTYVQIQEGQDRNVAAENLGSTLPIISRYNFKTFTDKNYALIGAAPWALTTNFESNLNDAELMRMLLDNESMIQAFLARPDVAPLLEDPQMLLAFAQDEDSLAEFFNSKIVQQVLGQDTLLRTTAGSRFMGYLLISKAGKYFRAHPQEAVAVINASPTLSALRQNPSVRQAVKENPKLGPLAAQLLGEEVKPAQKTPSVSKKTTASKPANSAKRKK